MEFDVKVRVERDPLVEAKLEEYLKMKATPTTPTTRTCSVCGYLTELASKNPSKEQIKLFLKLSGDEDFNGESVDVSCDICFQEVIKVWKLYQDLDKIRAKIKKILDKTRGRRLKVASPLKPEVEDNFDQAFDRNTGFVDTQDKTKDPDFSISDGDDFANSDQCDIEIEDDDESLQEFVIKPDPEPTRTTRRSLRESKIIREDDESSEPETRRPRPRQSKIRAEALLKTVLDESLAPKDEEEERSEGEKADDDDTLNSDDDDANDDDQISEDEAKLYHWEKTEVPIKKLPMPPEALESIKHIAHSDTDCPHCSKKFASCHGSSGLRHHILRVHLKVKQYQCGVSGCDKLFSSTGEVSQHFGIHHVPKDKAKTFPCSHCGKAFMSLRSLIIHKTVVHNQPLKKRKGWKKLNVYKCDVGSCEFVVTDKNVLEKHKNTTHFGTKTHACFACDKLFKAQLLLRKHQKYFCPVIFPVKSERPKPKPIPSRRLPNAPTPPTFLCSRCPQKFVNEKNLRVHEKRHDLPPPTDPKPKRPPQRTVVCELCGKKIGENMLEQHKKRIHEQIKNYFCDQCGRGYFGKHDLEKHIKTRHVEGKLPKPKYNAPTDCPECGRTFTCAGTMRDHLRNVHMKIFRFNCDYCEMKFFFMCHLRGHLKKVHKVIVARPPVDDKPKRDTSPVPNDDNDNLQTIDNVAVDELVDLNVPVV